LSRRFSKEQAALIVEESSKIRGFFPNLHRRRLILNFATIKAANVDLVFLTARRLASHTQKKYATKQFLRNKCAKKTTVRAMIGQDRVD